MRPSLSETHSHRCKLRATPGAAGRRLGSPGLVLGLCALHLTMHADAAGEFVPRGQCAYSA